ncbi:MAG: hypothetical protein ACR2MZ_12970 [Candidatus Dormibacter sp.]
MGTRLKTQCTAAKKWLHLKPMNRWQIVFWLPGLALALERTIDATLLQTGFDRWLAHNHRDGLVMAVLIGLGALTIAYAYPNDPETGVNQYVPTGRRWPLWLITTLVAIELGGAAVLLTLSATGMALNTWTALAPTMLGFIALLMAAVRGSALKNLVDASAQKQSDSGLSSQP